MRRWGLVTSRRALAIAVAGVALAMAPVAAIGLGALFVPATLSNGGAPARNPGNDTWNQVRIEQRVIIRITPGLAGPVRELPPPGPPPLPERLRQRRMAPCVPVAAIAGVQPLAANRLLLFMRDRRLVGADLARNCNARDFYLGFYVTPTPDGQLCAARDAIHSRAGATCLIAAVHELVPMN